ncbi:MAG: type I-U CRISPR-associated protein Cas7 [Acidobacteria bacterium]|nr:type I-U CRISPR-associated protein Cas7 [Acidobacteriota bacterium]
MAVALKVADGFDRRFQPTGFPNLGPALYKAMNNGAPADYLLVESAQSLANWMEALCLDPQKPCRYNADCAGIPYVIVRDTVNKSREDLTSSLTEPHRLASDELVEKAKHNNRPFKTVLESLLDVNKQRPVHLPRIARRLFYLDPACLLHGVFLEKLDGRIRFPRLLSATITAKDAEPVNAGGVMRGYVTVVGEEASIPYTTQHFSSSEIKLHLTFHVDSLKGLGLDEGQETFLASFALYKINRLLGSFPRLRTACVLDPEAGLTIKPNLREAINAAFTPKSRAKTFGGATVDALSATAKGGGFKPLEVLGS